MRHTNFGGNGRAPNPVGGWGKDTIGYKEVDECFSKDSDTGARLEDAGSR